MIGPGETGLHLDLEIQVIGAPVLRRCAEAVGGVDAWLRDLVERMFRTMYGTEGQGLAAPQVGHSIRVAVVDVPPQGPPYVLLNPRIAWASRARAQGVEGCLSIPGVAAVVERPAEVVVEALDLDWSLQTLGAGGELARCLQHEIDHLDGILYTDRLSPLSRNIALARYHKRARGRWRGSRGKGGP
jgi:peptide deformylase